MIKASTILIDTSTPRKVETKAEQPKSLAQMLLEEIARKEAEKQTPPPPEKPKLELIQAEADTKEDWHGL